MAPEKSNGHEFKVTMAYLTVIAAMLGWFGVNLDNRIEKNEDTITIQKQHIDSEMGDLRSEHVSDFRDLKQCQAALDKTVAAQKVDIKHLIRLVEKIDDKIRP